MVYCLVSAVSFPLSSSPPMFDLFPPFHDTHSSPEMLSGDIMFICLPNGGKEAKRERVTNRLSGKVMAVVAAAAVAGGVEAHV